MLRQQMEALGEFSCEGSQEKVAMNLPLFEQYRPKDWAEVVAQDGAIEQVHRVGRRGYSGRAWWTCGQSGMGKTTIARLIAREVASEWCIQELDASEVTPSIYLCYAISSNPAPTMAWAKVARHLSSTKLTAYAGMLCARSWCCLSVFPNM